MAAKQWWMDSVLHSSRPMYVPQYQHCLPKSEQYWCGIFPKCQHLSPMYVPPFQRRLTKFAENKQPFLGKKKKSCLANVVTVLNNISVPADIVTILDSTKYKYIMNIHPRLKQSVHYILHNIYLIKWKDKALYIKMPLMKSEKNLFQRNDQPSSL